MQEEVARHVDAILSAPNVVACGLHGRAVFSADTRPSLTTLAAIHLRTICQSGDRVEPDRAEKPVIRMVGARGLEPRTRARDVQQNTLLLSGSPSSRVLPIVYQLSIL